MVIIEIVGFLDRIMKVKQGVVCRDLNPPPEVLSQSHLEDVCSIHKFNSFAGECFLQFALCKKWDEGQEERVPGFSLVHLQGCF